MEFINNLKNKSGFSLIELLGVITVIGIISLVSLPAYIKIKPTLDLNSEVRDIASDLRYAQQLSVTEQINYSVMFDKNSNQYSIINTVSNDVIKTKNINPNISIDSITDLTDDTAIFNVTGAAIEHGSIVLVNSNNSTSTISIKPSGYVKIEQ